MTKNKHENVLSFLQSQTNKYDDRVALGMRSRYGWSEYTYNGLSLMSRKIASYLINDLKVAREEKIAIISESKVEFGAVFFASVIAGTTLIPLDIKLTKHELKSIMSNCSPKIVFVSQKYLKTAIELKEEIPSIETIILMDDMGDEIGYKNIYRIPENYDTKLRHRRMDSVALIIYTSGTTGAPKGVQTTFRNLYSQIVDLKKAMENIFKEGTKVNIMSILPMNHLFELSFGFCAFLNLGYSIYYTKTLRPADVLSVMRAKKIHFMCTVPSFFKMLKMQFESEIAKQSKFKQFMYNINYHYIAKFLPFQSIRKMLFKDIHEKLGNDFYGFCSGGAPMDTEMGKYFDRIGVNVTQGYGLSEASPVVTFSMGKKIDLKSVGFLLDSYKAKLDPETGELMVKGPAVMKGYYQRPDLTGEVITEDGWLHTGDIAKIDKKGQVFITGRIKNMIVLAGGKKVFPEEVEKALDGSQFMKEFCVIATTKKSGSKKGTEEVTVVAVPDDETKEKYDEKTVESLITSEIKKRCLKLCEYKRPTNIVVVKDELPKTATQKIKRKEIVEFINSR